MNKSNKPSPIRGRPKTFKPSRLGKKTRTLEATKPTAARAESAKVQEEGEKETSIKKRSVEKGSVDALTDKEKTIPLKQEAPKWLEEISKPEDLANHEVSEVTEPSNVSWINSIAQPTVEFVLKMMLTFGSATPISPEEDQEIAMMAKWITEKIQSVPAEMQHRVVSNLTNMVTPISTLATKYTPKVMAEIGKNILPFYKNLYLTLSQTIIDAMLNEEFADDAVPPDLATRKTMSYVSSELCWESTSGINSDVQSIMQNVLHGPLFTVIMDSFIGSYGFGPPLSNLIKVAVKQSINQIAKLPIRQAVNVVMQNLMKLAEERKA